MKVETVFLSSRHEETTLHRRVVFDAIIAAGYIPLASETMPLDPFNMKQASHLLDSVATTVAIDPTKAQEDREAAERAFKIRVDDIISKADRFIGIYADTIGRPRWYFCGLRPIEYEFLRFMVQWRYRLEFSDDEERVRTQLGRVFDAVGRADTSPGDYVSKISKATAALDYEVRQINAELARLRSNAIDPMLPLSDESRARFGTYGRVFHERVRLFLRHRSDDGFSSTYLMTMLRDKPYTEYFEYMDQKRSMRRVEEVGAPSSMPRSKHGGAPAIKVLFEDAFDWLMETHGRLSYSDYQSMRDRCMGIMITRSLPRPGYMSDVCEVLFREGYNILDIRLLESRTSPDIPAMCIHVSPFHERQAHLSNTDVEVLLSSIPASQSTEKADDAYPTVTCDLMSAVEFAKWINDEGLRCRLDGLSEEQKKSLRVVRMDTANIPGIVYRVSRILGNRNTPILFTKLHQLSQQPKNGVKFLDTHKFRIFFVIDTGHLDKADRELLIIQNELRLQMDVFDVRIGLIQEVAALASFEDNRQVTQLSSHNSQASIISTKSDAEDSASL